MNKHFKAFFLITVSAFCLKAAYAEQNVGTPGHRVASSERIEAGDCKAATSSVDLNINDVRAELLNGGDMWWDLVSAARYEVPYSADELQRGPSSLFAGAVWVGGFDLGGQLKVAAATYRQNGNDYFPGPLDANGTTNLATCNLWDHQYQVFASEILKVDSIITVKGLPLDPTDIPDNMKNWPARGNPYNAIAGGLDMAPFYDYDHDGVYDPTQGDYPALYSDGRTQYADQMIWWVYNDKGNIHTESKGQAIGLEVHTLAFAFKTSDQVNDMTFYEYTLYNKATTVLDSTFMGQWCDPDLGCYTDDYVGCDSGRSMGIVYNASANDGGKPSSCALNYGNQPPLIGIDYFKGPLDATGKELGMSSFLYYNNDFTEIGNPTAASHYYGYMSGSWKDGTHFTEGGTAHGGKVNTNFVFPGSPDAPLPAWSECSEKNTPADRRFVQASGPFTLEPGATNQIIIGAVWVRPPVGTYPCPTFSLLQIADDKAQALFNSNFKILNGPDAPNLDITELDQKLIISLVQNTNAVETKYQEADPALLGKTTDSLYKFQGYKIYQLVNPTVTNTELSDPAKARLIEQCDIKDGVATLINIVHDGDLNADVPVKEVAGADEGIIHSFVVDNDAFATGNEKRIVNFQPYYFLAISYAYNSSTIQQTPYLPGRRNIRVYTGFPHKPAPEQGGTVVNSFYGEGPEITRQEGGGNGGTTVELVQASVDEILANNSTMHPTYQKGAGPVTVKVVDPKNIPSATFDLFMRDTTLFTYSKNFRVVDTTIMVYQSVSRDSLGSCMDSIKGGTHAYVGGSTDTINGQVVVTGGRDTIIGGTHVKYNCTQYTYDVHDSLINTHTYRKLYPYNFVTNNPYDVAHVRDTSVVFKKTTNPLFPTVLDDTTTWTLRMTTGDSVVSERNISSLNEQIIPDWGLSVYIKQVRNPGSNSADDNNGLISSGISYDNAQYPWLTGIADGEKDDIFNWIRAGLYAPLTDPDNTKDYPGIDDGQAYEKILGGTWAPFRLANTYPKNAGNFSPAFSTSEFIVSTRQNMMDSLCSVDIVFTSDKSKWTHCFVVEANSDPNLSEGGVPKGYMRAHGSVDQNGNPDYNSNGGTGMGWFPGYAIDPDRGRRLNILFAEDSRDIADNGNDMMWDPTASFSSANGIVMGGRHYIYIMRSNYDQDAKYATGLAYIKNQVSTIKNVYQECAWTSMPLLASGFHLNSVADGIIPTLTKIEIRVSKAYQTIASDVTVNSNRPHYTFSLDGLAATKNDATVAKTSLDTINVVPNPYYAYSGYELNQLDNRVRITNLPQKCEISIYSLDGTLVKTITRDDAGSTFVDWNLQNNTGVPIASGVYLIHIKADGIGERTLKWFGVMRPVDLSSF